MQRAGLAEQKGFCVQPCVPEAHTHVVIIVPAVMMGNPLCCVSKITLSDALMW